MATKLKNLQLTSVDLVRAGANQEADILLYKSADAQEAAEGPVEGADVQQEQTPEQEPDNAPVADSEAAGPVEKDYTTFGTINANREHDEQLWRYTDALATSIRSIKEDNSLDAGRKLDLMRKSLGEFDTAMADLFSSLCGCLKDTPKAKQAEPKRYDRIVEVEKFNPYHDSRGRFSSANGAYSFTYAPGKSRAHDLAIEREKKRTTIIDGEDQLRRILREDAVVKLEGIDPKSVEPTVSAIKSVVDRYPNAKYAYAGFTTDEPEPGYFDKHPSAIACYSPRTSMIHLNKKIYADREAQERRYQECVDKKHFPEGTSCDSSVVHEMGHALDFHLSRETLPRDARWKGESVSGRLWNNMVENGRKSGKPIMSSDIADSLSRYASANHREYFAEGFSELMTNPNPRAAARSVGKAIDRYYKRLG